MSNFKSRCGYCWDIHHGLLEWPMGQITITDNNLHLKSFRKNFRIPFEKIDSVALFSVKLGEGKIRLHIPDNKIAPTSEIFIYSWKYKEILLKLNEKKVHMN